jgi:MOSC domain-containing protein YiiM
LQVTGRIRHRTTGSLFEILRNSGSVTQEINMKLVSVNVGLPRAVISKGKSITTGIFKEPVEGRIRVETLNLVGDRQADLKVRGGIHKAVYGYPAEHYEFWRHELPGIELPWGMFGENLTIEGLLEDEVNIGDQLRIGSAELVVTQARLPCYKLAVKFGREDIIKRFLESGRTGFYFAVIKEGEVEAGNSIEIISRDGNALTIAVVTQLYINGEDDLETLRLALKVDALPDSWKHHFERQLEQLRAKS